MAKNWKILFWEYFSPLFLFFGPIFLPFSGFLGSLFCFRAECGCKVPGSVDPRFAAGFLAAKSRALLKEGERNGGYAIFAWQEREHKRPAQMTHVHMSSLKPLSWLFQNEGSLRRRCVIQRFRGGVGGKGLATTSARNTAKIVPPELCSSTQRGGA